MLAASKRILICVGSGGVGKTTTAATLGMAAARKGRKTLVMTIDPARRLAAALGLSGLDNTPRRIPDNKSRAGGMEPGLFHAMMLEPKRTFDEMVRRYAPDQATVEHLLSSKLYQQISSRLAGSQEYAAMEMLYAIREDDRYDLLVLDTPPTANALDFLDAPGKMVGAVQSPAVSLFVKTYEQAGKLSLEMLGFGASYVVKRLARFVGSEFLDDIAEFLTRLSGLLGGMEERAARVQQMLRDEEVGFVIVTSPNPSSVDEALAFCERLRTSEMNLSGLIVNRVHPVGDELDLDTEQLTARVGQLLELPPPRAAEAGGALLKSHELLQALARADESEIQRLREQCEDLCPELIQVPLFDEDIFDISRLNKLGQYLGCQDGEPGPAR